MGDKQKTFRLNRHTHTHTHKRSPPVVNKSCWHGWLNEIVNKKKNTITRIDIHPRYCGSIGLVSLVVVVVVFGVFVNARLCVCVCVCVCVCWLSR